MSAAFTVRKWHKWLSLIIGLQAFLWLGSGVYMVVVDLDFIHGDHLVRRLDEPLPATASQGVPISDIRSQFGGAERIDLVSWLGIPHYRVSTKEGAHMVDARTGTSVSPLTREDAVRAAAYYYAGEGAITSARLLAPGDERPTEIQARPLPLWQIQFDDFGATSFYISPNDGHLVARRHSFWRGFDFFWMLHIMDYEAREDVNNSLFRVTSIFGTVMASSGMWLLFYSFRRRNKIAKDNSTSGGQK